MKINFEKDGLHNFNYWNFWAIKLLLFLINLNLKNMSQAKLKSTFIFLFFLCSLNSFFGQQINQGKNNVEVYKTYTQKVLGKNIGYYVEFKNNGTKSVDGLKWIANFYNNFGDYKGNREGSWESGNFISVLAPGEITKDLESNYVKDATKVFIIIKTVHYTNN